MHCSMPYTLKCATYCATRADGGGHESRAAGGLPKRREWCKRAVEGRVADEWCTVHSAVPAHDACCGLNASCTEIFGSNSWPGPCA